MERIRDNFLVLDELTDGGTVLNLLLMNKEEMFGDDLAAISYDGGLRT